MVCLSFVAYLSSLFSSIYVSFLSVLLLVVVCPSTIAFSRLSLFLLLSGILSSSLFQRLFICCSSVVYLLFVICLLPFPIWFRLSIFRVLSPVVCSSLSVLFIYVLSPVFFLYSFVVCFSPSIYLSSFICLQSIAFFRCLSVCLSSVSIVLLYFLPRMCLSSIICLPSFIFFHRLPLVLFSFHHRFSVVCRPDFLPSFIFVSSSVIHRLLFCRLSFFVPLFFFLSSSLFQDLFVCLSLILLSFIFRP